MGKVLNNLSIEVSDHAKNLLAVLLEGKDVSNSKVYTGSKWILKFDEFTTQDDDLDVFILMNGDPGVAATITVKANGLSPEETSEQRTFRSLQYILRKRKNEHYLCAQDQQSG